MLYISVWSGIIDGLGNQIVIVTEGSYLRQVSDGQYLSVVCYLT